MYDAFGNLAVEYQSGTIVTPACLTCYLTWDHLGSVRMVSDTLASGFTGFHDYAPFGEEVLGNAGRTADWGTAANGTDYLNQRYTGAERDTETGLDNMQARYMASMQARFMRPDPAGNFLADPTNPQSWNLYTYAWNNPLAYFDPSGLCSIKPGDTDATDDPGELCVAPGGTSVTVDGGSPPPVEFDDCTFCESMLGGGGGSNSGSANSGSGLSLTSVIRKIGQVAMCASNFASTYSIAGGLKALGIGQSGAGGFIRDALSGNVLSGITDLGAGIVTGSGGGNNVFYNMGQSVAAGPLQGVPAIGPLSGLKETPWGSSASGLATRAIVGGVHSLANSASGASLTTLSGETSIVSLTGAEFAVGVGEVKLGYDIASYAAGVAVCTAGHR